MNRLKEHIFMIGFMGVGKTSTSRILSKKLGVKENDTDAMIVKQEKKRLADIIKSSRKNIPAKDKIIFFLVYIGNPFHNFRNMYCCKKAFIYAACVNKITYSERNNNALIN